MSLQKFILIILIGLLIFTPTSYADEEYDFRNVNWGMEREKVINQEGIFLEIEEEDNFIVFEEDVLGVDMRLYYYFFEEKLAKAQYVSQEDYFTNYNYYISDYENLKNRLQKRYGNPENDEEIYKDSFIFDLDGDDKLLLASGNLKYISEWLTANTKIKHELYATGESGVYEAADIAHSVTYISKEYEYLIEEYKQEEIEEKL